MLKRIYLKSALSLIERYRNRLNNNIPAREMEVEELFYWVLSVVEKYTTTNWFHNDGGFCIIAKGTMLENSNGKIVLEHRAAGNYVSQFVFGDEFISVMEEVTSLFNEIGEESGGTYKAKCISDRNNLELDVWVES